MSTKSWTVVKFDDENTVEAVPTTWILGSSCYWPPYSRDKLVAAIKNFEAPNTHWPLHKMEVFRNATFDSYLEARKKSNVAEYASDLNIDEEASTRKNRHKRAKTLSSSSDDEQQFRQSSQKRTSIILPKPPTKPTYDQPAKENIPPINVNITKENMAGTSNAGPDVCCCCPAHKQIFETGGVDMKQIKKQYLFMTNILADMKSEITDIKSKVLSAQELATPPLNESFFMKFKLPVNDIGALQVLEEYLSSDENFQKTVPEISNMGGNNVYDFVKRSMTLLITNNLAKSFSFQGKKQKSSFSKLKLSELVIKAAEHSKVTTTRKETENSISKWLRRANERKGE